MWRAACRYRLERLLLKAKSIIDRSTSVAASGYFPKRVGGLSQDFVMVSVQFVRTLQHKTRCPIQGWP